MQLDLPTPIKSYFVSEQTDATEMLGDVFANDAIVRDESATHRGLEAIKLWKQEGKQKTGYTILPQSVHHRDEQTIVFAEVAGRFPGTPAMLTYSFKLQGERIIELEIH